MSITQEDSLSVSSHNATGTAMHFSNQDFGGLGPNEAPANMNNGGLDSSLNHYKMLSVVRYLVGGCTLEL